MADGKVVIQVEMDGNKAQSGVSKLKSLLGGLSESGAKLGSVFKSVLGANLISGAVMSGVNALTGSIKGAFSTIISEGAALQQSIGGVETLFKGSAGKVKAYAEEAFRTAGLSANAYMENVTSFSASLLQSLGGDTEKAAEVANRAMIDMSDNANKMGTDIGRIQDAYQGFAKDNYTMLDNLKLGYGGTKTEMQRLIKDAAAMKDIQEELNVSVEDGNMSFGNIVNAISVMQKKLEITGTTAKEASSTLSGSFASMKAAWQNLAGKLALGMDIGPALKNLVSTASTFLLGNFLPMVGNIMRQLPKAISGALAEAGPQIEKGFKALFSSFGADPAIFNTIKETFRDIVVTVETVFATLTNKANGFNDVISGVGNIIKLVNFAIQDLAGAIQFALEAFAETDAINNAYKAFKDLTEAALDLAMKLSDVIPWDVVGAAAGHLVNAISTIISWISKLSQLISKDVWSGLITGIGGGVLAFKAFNFLQSFNPFNIFKKNATEAASGAAEAVTQGRSKIAQILSSLSSVIGSIGGAVKSAAIGIGIGIKAALSGLSQVILAFGAALQTAGVANILAFGGAVATAAVGIGAGVAIIAAGFALLATQGQGVATIINAVGDAFATVATAIIGAFAQAIVTVAGVLPIVTSALANLAPLIVAFGQAFGAAAPFVSALGEAITSIASVLPPVISAFSQGVAAIIEAVTPIVEIIGNVFTTVAQIVADAIVRIVQALAPFMPAVVQIAQALAPVLQSIAEAFTALVAQISPIIDSIANLFRTLGNVIKSVLDGAKGVIEGFGKAVRTILDGVSGIFDSIGQAALNAGKGFNLLANGVVKITNTNLGDMAASLGAVALGVGKIASNSAGLAQAGNGMKILGVGMTTVSSQANTAVSGLTNFATRITSIQTAVTALPAILTSAASSFASFASQVVSGIAGLSAINAPISALRTQITTIAPALLQAAMGFTVFGAQVIAINSSLTIVSATFVQVGASAASASGQITAISASTASAIAAFASMSAQVQSSMQMMLSVVRSTGSQMISQGRQTGQQTSQNIAQGIRGGGGQVRSAMSSLVNAARSVGMSGAATMRYVGAMIGQGLAQGMYSALGAVTAAANALVAQAERAAQAKARIHSPSRLFRDNVGRYISQGVAVGILADAHKVDDAMGDVYDQIRAFKYAPEDIIGVGQAQLSRTVQVKSDLERSIKASVKVVQEKSNNLVERALEVAEKAVKRPVNMMLDDGALVAKIGKPMTDYQNDKLLLDNMMRGIT
jgi:phage-related protein